MKLKFNLKLLLYIILIFPYIKPNYVIQISIINKAYNFMQIVNFIFIIIAYIKSNMKIPKEIMIVFFWQIILIFSTIYNNGQVKDIFINTIQVISFILIIEYLMTKNVNVFFEAITSILIILIVINFITIIYKPDGFLVGYLKEWLFGTKNNHFSIVLPAISLSYIYYIYLEHKNKIIYIILSIISILTIFIMNSATSIVGICFFYMYFVFIKQKVTKINIKKLSYLYIILFIGVIIFQLQNYFSFIIENILHKDLTFTGRTDIWSRAINFIKSSPIIGYGDEGNQLRTFKFCSKSSIHCHNMILEICYQGGIIGGILLIVFIKNIIMKLDNIKDVKLYNFAVWIILTYFVALFTEVYSFEVILWVFTVISNLWRLNNCQRNEEGG